MQKTCKVEFKLRKLKKWAFNDDCCHEGKNVEEHTGLGIVSGALAPLAATTGIAYSDRENCHRESGITVDFYSVEVVQAP